MLLKSIDKKDGDINQLTALLSKSKSYKQKKLIQEELSKIKNGYEAEKDNAYYIDFMFKDGKHSYLLHDIRIEHNGLVAQIDHIIITRFGIEILESKSFSGVLTIKQDGSLNVKYKNGIKTFPNPIEQNNRHIKILSDFIHDYIDLPINIKIFGGIPISSKVLINPKTTITNQKLPPGFERADSFCSSRDKEIENMSTISTFKTVGKFMTIDKAKEIAELLIEHHNPIKFDYTKRFGIPAPVSKQTISSKPMQAHIKEAVMNNNKINICNQIHKDIALCSKCKSPNIEIRYGKYGYYFKCLFCGGNTAINLTCSTKDCKPRLKKRKEKFYKICNICKTEELFFTNKK